MARYQFAAGPHGHAAPFASRADVGLRAFDDRDAAGRELAMLLARTFDADDFEDAIVLALPRGGVPVAAAVAEELELPLDVVLVRKIGAPGHAEFGIGAIVEDGEAWIDERSARMSGATDHYIAHTVDVERARIVRYRELYCAGQPPVDVRGRNTIVVDDGVATGGTARAVGRHLRASGARTTALAVPVAPPHALVDLADDYDRLFAVLQPEHFASVGAWYRRFDPPSDPSIAAMLQLHRRQE